MSKAEGVWLVLTSAIVIDGDVCRPDTLVEVTEPEAKNLLTRGRARLATEGDKAKAGVSVAPKEEVFEPEPKAKQEPKPVKAKAGK